jgi:hypothetical protein
MSRYIKNVARVASSLGPSEERGYAMWVGYEIVGVDDDLSHLGLLKADDAGDRGVTSFVIVEPDDAAMYEKLGLAIRRDGR